MKEILQIFNQSLLDNTIEASKYQYYGVKKGLRNEDHTGVLVGLTRIADVVGYEKVDDEKIECEGKLYYRDYEINEMFDHVDIDKHLGFEQCAFLLLFGHLPSSSELTTWLTVIREHVELPKQFLENNILTCKSSNMMNRLQQALLGLYAYDCHADDASVSNTLVQGIQLIAKMPALIVYHYQAKIHTFDHASLIIHPIDPNDTISESILRLVRKDQNFTESEVQLLDTLLILHADHGGGNNSTFTNVVVSSTGTDLYSSLSASIGSLKGPRHGGANLAVMEMMEAVIEEIGLCEDEQVIKALIRRILAKDFYDHSGLVYGMGHAVYTLSDPRSLILQKQAVTLA